MTQPDPQGARALAERLLATDTDGLSLVTYRKHAAAILGEHGLFIADRTKHEPYDLDSTGQFLLCKCGHETKVLVESYFDHLNGAPR